MSEVSHRALPELLSQIEKGTRCPVYLFYGDEFLYKEAFRSLLDALLPLKHQALNYEPLDGEKVNAYEVVERLNTFPLIPSPKVVAVHGTKAFYSLVAADEFLRRSEEAWEAGNFKEAARYFLHVLGLADATTEDLKDGNWPGVVEKELGGGVDIDGKSLAETPWVTEVVRYCIEEHLAVSGHQDDADVLNEAITEGFPENNTLVLTTDLVDKRRRLYKTIKKKGAVVDCSVPTGQRTADKRQQQDALKHHMKSALGSAGKTVARGTFEVLYEKVGPEMRRFSSELDKLVSFVGDRREILPSDVEEISKRTKEDPIYEMTSAIADRETSRALFYLDSLLKGNVFHLQVLAAAANQVRKLILAKDFVRGRYGRHWRPDLNYATFQKSIFPQLQKSESDLLTGKAHPYAVYMTLKQSDNYAFEELTGALKILLDADVRLKRSRQDPKMVLERAIIEICGSYE